MIKQEAGGLPAQAAEKALIPPTQAPAGLNQASSTQLWSLNSVLHHTSLLPGPGRVFKKFNNLIIRPSVLIWFTMHNNNKPAATRKVGPPVTIPPHSILTLNECELGREWGPQELQLTPFPFSDGSLTSNGLYVKRASLHFKFSKGSSAVGQEQEPTA